MSAVVRANHVVRTSWLNRLSVVVLERAIGPAPSLTAINFVALVDAGSKLTLDDLSIKVPVASVGLALVELPDESHVAIVEPVGPLGLVSVSLGLHPEIARITAVPLADLSITLLGVAFDLLTTVPGVSQVLSTDILKRQSSGVLNTLS